jgi:hypothetical protein
MTKNGSPLTRTAIGVVVVVMLFSTFGCTTSEPSTQESLTQEEQERIEPPKAEEGAKEAKEKTVEALKAVQLACEAYAVDWGFYPTAATMTELRPIAACPINCVSGRCA